MTLQFGNIYEFKFQENGPRPPNYQESGPVRIAGFSIQDALSRWDESRVGGGYVPYYPAIVSVTLVLEGTYY